MIEVETPDGIVEFPDTMSDAQIKAVLRRKYAKVEDNISADPTQGMSGMQKFLAGTGKGMTDLVRGAGQVMGLVDQEEIDAAARRDAPLMDTGAGVAGNIVGASTAMIPALAIPGAATLPGAIALGAAEGALQPVPTGESRLDNAVAGAAGGAVGHGATRALGRVLAPETDTAVKGLMEEGITPTPGQILGGAAKKAESALESVPFVGTGIREAKGKAIEEFNQATLNRVLEPLGKKIDKIGHEGVAEARNLVENAYENAIKGLKRVDFDSKFDGALSNIRQMAQQLPAERARQINKIIDDSLLGKMTPAKTMSGQSFKESESAIKRLAREYRQSTDADQRQVGDALNAVVDAMRAQASRTNPKVAESLKEADTAYARLLRAERAASMQGAPDGIFTPSQLGNSVRSMDSSLRKKDIAQGKGLMQDLTTAGREVLGDSLPNSGTADRLLSTAALGGGYLFDPFIAAGMVGGRAAYTSPGRRAIAAALTKRPEAVRTAGEVVKSTAPYAGLVGIQGFLNE